MFVAITFWHEGTSNGREIQFLLIKHNFYNLASSNYINVCAAFINSMRLRLEVMFCGHSVEPET